MSTKNLFKGRLSLSFTLLLSTVFLLNWTQIVRGEDGGSQETEDSLTLENDSNLSSINDHSLDDEPSIAKIKAVETEITSENLVQSPVKEENELTMAQIEAVEIEVEEKETIVDHSIQSPVNGENELTMAQIEAVEIEVEEKETIIDNSLQSPVKEKNELTIAQIEAVEIEVEQAKTIIDNSLPSPVKEENELTIAQIEAVEIEVEQVETIIDHSLPSPVNGENELTMAQIEAVEIEVKEKETIVDNLVQSPVNEENELTIAQIEAVEIEVEQAQTIVDNSIQTPVKGENELTMAQIEAVEIEVIEVKEKETIIDNSAQTPVNEENELTIAQIEAVEIEVIEVKEKETIIDNSAQTPVNGENELTIAQIEAVEIEVDQAQTIIDNSVQTPVNEENELTIAQIEAVEIENSVNKHNQPTIAQKNIIETVADTYQVNPTVTEIPSPLQTHLESKPQIPTLAEINPENNQTISENLPDTEHNQAQKTPNPIQSLETEDQPESQSETPLIKTYAVVSKNLTFAQLQALDTEINRYISQSQHLISEEGDSKPNSFEIPTFDNLPLITAESDSDIPKITQTTTEEEESSEDESEETSDNETETPTDSIPTTPPDTETVEQETPAEEPRVLVAEVVVTGADLQLERLVYNTIATKPGRTATRSQLQNDVNAIYATGFFANVKVVPEDTPLGIRITFSVEPNPILENVVIETVPETEKERVLPEEIIKDNFDEQYGKILNLRDLQESIQAINEWYSSNGYDLAQVIGSPQISEDGVVTLIISEGVIEDIQVRFFDAEDEALDGGRTRDFIVTREMRLKPGDVFNRNTAQQDLQRVFGLGLFEDVRLAFSPGEDPSEVIVNVDVVEGRTGSVAAGAGISSTSGLFGTLSYQEQNLGGNNQTVATELQVGERDLLFDVSFTDPWIATDPFRTSYTANIFRRRTISLVFDGDNSTIRTLNGFDSPRVVRTGTGVTFVRPLAEDVFTRPDWRLTAGFNYQRVQVKNADGDNSPFSAPLNGFPSQPLSFDSSGNDDLFTFNIGAAQDTRNNPLQPTRGSVLRLGMEQTVPVGSGSILFNRVRGSYSFYVPLDFIDFGFIEEGQPKPQALAFNFQAGTVLGDLPPYEAFVIGGSNSVRGYAEGEVGSGRSYFQATAEYRFPIIAIIGGALFVDYGTVLGSDGAVPGVPSRVRGLPGNGTGYGLGVRIQSPVGPIRIDYGFRDGGSRLHFGIGERF